jgi:Zn-dependent metalloprotease
MKNISTRIWALVLLSLACLPLHAQRTFDSKKKQGTQTYRVRQQKPARATAPNILQRSRTFDPLFLDGQHRILAHQSSSHLPSFISTNRNLAHAKAYTRKDPVAGSFAYINEIQHLTTLGNAEENFKISRISLDQNSTTHIRMNQYFKGIPVHGAEVIVHVNRFGQGESFNGKYLKIENTLSTTPSLEAKAANAIVKQHIGKSSSIHELSALERQFVQHAEPDTELCIYQSSTSERPVLAYHVKYSPSLHARWAYFVDAQKGTIIHHVNTTCYIDGPKTTAANDLNGISRTVNSYQKGTTFFMVDVSRSMFQAGSSVLPDEPIGGIMTIDLNNTFGDNTVVKHITTTTNSWNTKSVSAHFNAGSAFEYYKADHSRIGIDGDGGTIISIINAPDEDGGPLDNAFWNGKAMFYGNGNIGFKALAGSMDVAGHEMTHGVVENTANLEYEGESGAINESMADVFGAMMDPTDWLIGEDVVKTAVFPSGALRSLEDPHNGGTNLSDNGFQPKHVNEQFTGSQDNGGVHINSGISNHAFFRYATAITRAKAAKVYYKALTDYLTKSSQFIDLRLAVIQAAKDLFGDNSTEATQAGLAFDAVGIASGPGGDYTNNIETNPGTEFLLVYSTDTDDDNTLYRIQTSNSNITALSTTPFLSKPSVTDDGSAAVFVGTDHKIYVVITTPTEETQEFILDDRPIWSNAVVSKGGNRLAAITEGADQAIHIYDFVTEAWQGFELYNPTYSEGIESGGPLYADAIEWDYSGEYLVYDAFNRIVTSDGVDIEYWDVAFIHAWDKANQNFGTGEISKLFSSLPDGVSIGNASFSKNSPHILAFDFVDETNEEYAILGVNIETNDVGLIANNTTLGWPSFNKTDSRVAFTNEDGGDYYTGYVTLNSDKISSNDAEVTGLYNLTMWPVYFSTGDRIIGDEEEVTGIEDQQEKYPFNAYPNPFKDELLIKTEKPVKSLDQIQFMSILGQPVNGLHMEQRENTIKIYTQHLPAGQYIISIRDGKRSSFSKVIKVN